MALYTLKLVWVVTIHESVDGRDWRVEAETMVGIKPRAI
jgi:hypothetical protein